MNLYWKNKAPYTHKVKPPKQKPRDKNGYKLFLIKKAGAIIQYLSERKVL